MQLSVKNLGPIKKGSINLDKSLIIFTGPNNNGKSYLTYLIHGISQREELSIPFRDLVEIKNFINRYKPFINILKKDGDIDILDFLNSIEPTLSTILTKNIKENLYKIFASTNVSPDVEIQLGKFKLSTAVTAFKKIQIRDGKAQILTVKGKIDTDAIDGAFFKDYKTLKALIHRILTLLSHVYLDHKIMYRTYFFPAERTAINLFAKHITATKAEIKDEFDIESIATMTDVELGSKLRAQFTAGPKYPYAIRTYINFVNNFITPDKEGNYADLASEIETILTKGRISINEKKQLIFTPSDTSISLELHLSSSLVKSLSYFVLYVRYEAEYGDRIIIDEPELNLHPDLQISFAKIISKMINAGLNIIISTHSDYLIKELNNLILLGELSIDDKHKSFISEKGFIDDELFTKSQVGAYFLYSKPEGGIIDPINLEDNGLVIPTINEAIRRVDGLAEEIFLEMEG